MRTSNTPRTPRTLVHPAAIAAIVVLAAVASTSCDDTEQTEGDPGDRAAQQQSERSTGTDDDPKDKGDPPTGADRPTQMADISDDQSREGWSNRQEFYVSVAPSPNPIPFQELFSLTVNVYEDATKQTPMPDVALDQVRAVMPAHDHGMKVDPTVESTDAPGEFHVEGMRWHMKGPGKDGHWKVELVLNAGSTIDTATFDLQCCRPAE